MLRYNFVLAFAALYLLVNAQAPPPPPIIVDAGYQGTVYTPGSVTAAMGAVVSFEFFGDVHTVTQSSFEDPCMPLPGGFHSGYIMGLNLTAPVQVWNLIITNVSAPIWFFCATTQPSFHCSAGMVGAINPPSQAMYTEFKSAAMLITTTASVNPTPILTGVGAFASTTATPSLAAVSTSSSPTTSSSVTLPTSTSATSSTPSPSNTAASTTSHVGAIVGGSVGGVAFIGLIIVACFFFFVRRKQTLVDPDESLRYHPFPVQRGSEAFTQVQRPENFYPTGASIQSGTNTNSSIPTERFVPVRSSAGPALLQPPYGYRQESALSDIASSSSNLPSTLGRNVSDQPSNIDMRSLAQEVAAVLYQNPVPRHKDPQDMRGQPQAGLSVQNNDRDDTVSQMSDHPPNYQAATGPPIGLSGKA